MGTPHKHADMIKAWADGAEIECRQHNTNSWLPADSPGWANSSEYRIKPTKTILAYRVGLFRGRFGEVFVAAVDPNPAIQADAALGRTRIRWLGDAAKVEV